MSFAPPRVGIPTDRRQIGAHPFHAVGEKYVHAVARAAHALPLLMPVLPEPLDPQQLLASVDGLLLTGSPSNVHPMRYGAVAERADIWLDPERDATTLELIPRALAAGMPVLALCRGFQELNVALGGTLWQHVHEVPGHFDHREDASEPLEQQYAPAHELLIEPGSLMRDWAGGAARVRVNSLHSQGIRDLGRDLAVEARAPDGLIEAVRVTSARGFAWGVQWHPEWQVLANDFSAALFAAFGEACRAYAAARGARDSRSR